MIKVPQLLRYWRAKAWCDRDMKVHKGCMGANAKVCKHPEHS
jgi:hypothetical protein